MDFCCIDSHRRHAAESHHFQTSNRGAESMCHTSKHLRIVSNVSQATVGVMWGGGGRELDIGTIVLTVGALARVSSTSSSSVTIWWSGSAASHPSHSATMSSLFQKACHVIATPGHFGRDWLCLLSTTITAKVRDEAVQQAVSTISHR